MKRYYVHLLIISISEGIVNIFNASLAAYHGTKNQREPYTCRNPYLSSILSKYLLLLKLSRKDFLPKYHNVTAMHAINQ